MLWACSETAKVWVWLVGCLGYALLFCLALVFQSRRCKLLCLHGEANERLLVVKLSYESIDASAIQGGGSVVYVAFSDPGP